MTRTIARHRCDSFACVAQISCALKTVNSKNKARFSRQKSRSFLRYDDRAGGHYGNVGGAGKQLMYSAGFSGRLVYWLKQGRCRCSYFWISN